MSDCAPSSPGQNLGRRLNDPAPVLALAPMQDITDLAFWRVSCRYGPADVYYTEYFRVYHGSCLNKYILRCLTDNPTGRPVIAQMIGNDIPALVRTARELQEHPVAGVDLNLGCPAPIVYRKCAGGGLLRDLSAVERIIAALREAIRVPFTVKTRLGFESDRGFPELLKILGRHGVDLVTVHGRTVSGGYRSTVDYHRIREAVQALPCPVLANGNIISAAKALEVLGLTGARGLMIGRGAVRNPWLFRQIEAAVSGRAPTLPTGREVLSYITELFHAVREPGMTDHSHVQRIKKHMNFFGLGVDPDGRFLYHVRRVTKPEAFLTICQEFLAHDRPMRLEPYSLDLKETDVMAGAML
jgi:nifR3 family TIM-barrel protein